MALRHCQECNHSISTSAQFCPACGSSDPFGWKRAAKKRELWGLLLVSLIMLLLGLALKFGWISLPTLSQYLHKIR